ncbi:MAG: UMP kinase [Gammaproteobacteria bacterium]|nr:UMP kinase [Gammaproteobacteria bacterium]
MELKYQRILLKISGESLGGSKGTGYDPAVIQTLGNELVDLSRQNVQIAIVIGAGNIFRGNDLTDPTLEHPLNQVTADQIGMLGTVMNAMVFSETLERLGLTTHVFSTHEVVSITEGYSVKNAGSALNRGEVVLLAGGTGNPLFTTDTAASLRGIELGVDLVLKATKVDGVYDADPVRFPDAKRRAKLTYDEVIRQELQVMDLSAILLCREHKVPLIVYKLTSEGALDRICRGQNEGTLVTSD